MEIKTLPLTTNMVAAALGITPDQHIEFFFDFGYEYLMRYQADTVRRVPPHQIPNVMAFTRLFVKSPVFWFWWKLEFQKTDRAFMASTATGLSAYADAHRNRVLIPSQKVIDQVILLAKNTQKLAV